VTAGGILLRVRKVKDGSNGSQVTLNDSANGLSAAVKYFVY
jgi:hypothetical protein